MKKYYSTLCLFLSVVVEVFSVPSKVYAQAQAVISKQYALVYENDNIESYRTGIFSYAFPESFSGMDLLGNGKKAIAVSTQTAVNDTSVISFLSPDTFTPLWEIRSGGFDSLQTVAYTSAAQLTGSSESEYMIWRSSGGRSPNAAYFQVFSRLSQNALFTAGQDNDQYIAPVNLMNNTTAWNDLTGDSLLEFCRVKLNSRTMTASIVVYNDLKPVDTLLIPYTSSLVTVAFSNDINSDGRPEILFSEGSTVSVYQWNTSAGKFEKLAVLNSVIAMYSIPVNVDSDTEKEIITLSSGSDSIYVYSKDFQKKRGLTIKDKRITNFIIANLNGSPNSEIIISASAMESFLPATYVYDLSSGDRPIWSDNSFSTLGAFDLSGKGTSQILGLSPGGLTTKLLDGTDGFKALWEIKGKSITSAGPFVPGNLFAFGLSGEFIQIFNPDIRPLDLNNDGKKEIIISIRDSSSNAVYAVLGSDGIIEDSLLIINDPGTIFTQAYDFTNNGYPEIIVSQSSIFGQGQSRTWILQMQVPVGVSETGKARGSYHLNHNYPNPFNPSTVISYYLPERAAVELKIFDMLGREIASLIKGEQNAGEHSIQFNAANLSSGTYIYRLRAGAFVAAKKMVVVK